MNSNDNEKTWSTTQGFWFDEAKLGEPTKKGRREKEEKMKNI